MHTFDELHSLDPSAQTFRVSTLHVVFTISNQPHSICAALIKSKMHRDSVLLRIVALWNRFSTGWFPDGYNDVLFNFSASIDSYPPYCFIHFLPTHVITKKISLSNVYLEWYFGQVFSQLSVNKKKELLKLWLVAPFDITVGHFQIILKRSHKEIA